MVNMTTLRCEARTEERGAPEPACDLCGDTGWEPVWRMTRHGLEEAEQACRHGARPLRRRGPVALTEEPGVSA